MDNEIFELKQLIMQSNYTIAITGAGISVSAGIGDFQRMNFPVVLQMTSKTILEKAPNYYYKLANKAFLNAMFLNGATITHKKLAELEHNGLLQGIVTTNIDCLHSLAGSKNVAEIQGSFGINKCLNCEKHYDNVQIWNTGKIPKCPECGGVIGAFPVYKHIGLVESEVYKARIWASQAELVLIIGANGAYGNIYYDRIAPNAKIAQINTKKTQFDDVSYLNIHRECDKVFEQL